MPITYFRHTDGSLNIPVADGDVTVDGVEQGQSAQVHVAFYGADGETRATPTAGTVTFRAGLIEGQYLAASANGTVTASDVDAGDAAYTPPTFGGPIKHAKMTKASIAGATFVRAYIWTD